MGTLPSNLACPTSFQPVLGDYLFLTLLLVEFRQMRAPTVSDNQFMDSIIDCRRPGQLFFQFSILLNHRYNTMDGQFCEFTNWLVIERNRPLID